MTSNAARADALVGALRAAVGGDRDALDRALTDDVRVWTPSLTTSSRAELLETLERRDAAFSDVALDVVPLDVGGDHACAEWTAEMTHSGTLHVSGSAAVDATGIRVTLHGVTIAEFHGDQICALRQYWDDSDLLEQLGVLGD